MNAVERAPALAGLIRERHDVPGAISNDGHYQSDDVSDDKLPFSVGGLEGFGVDGFEYHLFVHRVHREVLAFVSDESSFAQSV